MALSRRVVRRRVNRTPFVISNFGGWNDDSNNSALEDRDLRRAENIMFYRERLIGGRYGYYRDPFSAAIGAGNPITGIVDWHPSRDSAPRPIFVAGTTINEDDGDGTPTAKTGTATITAGANNIFTFAVSKGTLLGTNGVNPPWELASTGTAAALSGWFANSRVAKYMHQQFGYVFAAGFTGTGNTGAGEGYNQHPMGVYYSDLFDHNIWAEDHTIDKVGGFSSFGDEYVTGMFRHRDFLMVGTNKRIYPCTYTGDIYKRFTIQRPLDVGLAHQRAAVSINGEYTFFMSPSGHIYTVREVATSFGDVGASRALTAKIRNYVDNLNRSRIQYTHGVFLEELGWVVWAVSAGVNQGSHNELLVLDLSEFPLNDPDPRATRWLRWKNVDANAMAALKRSTLAATQSLPQLNGYESLVFGTETGWAKRFCQNISYDETDAGVKDQISTDMATKYFDFGDPTSQKSVVEGYFDVEPSADILGPTVTIEYDYGIRQSLPLQIDMKGNIGERHFLDVDFVLDSSRLATAEGITRHRLRFINAGTNASLRIQKKLKNSEQWKMQAMTLVVELRGVSPEMVE